MPSIEEVERYLSMSKGDLHDLALPMIQTAGRPREIISLQKADVNLGQEFLTLPGTKTLGPKREVPLMQEALEALPRRSEESPNGYIFPVRRPKTKNKGVGYVTSLKKAHETVIEKHFTDAPFVPYDFRHTFALWCVQAGVGLAELAALLGHANLGTTMRYVHVLKQHKIAAVGKLEKYIQLTKRFKLRAEEEREEALSPVAEKW